MGSAPPDDLEGGDMPKERTWAAPAHARADRNTGLAIDRSIRLVFILWASQMVGTATSASRTNQLLWIPLATLANELRSAALAEPRVPGNGSRPIW